MNTEKSLGCSNRCRDIVIFKLLGCRPPASWISLNLCNRPNCVTVPGFVKIRQTAAEIWLFFDFSRWRPPPSWICKISNFFTVETVKRVELHHHAKFRRNRLNCGRDMVIFRFFKMETAAIWDFPNFIFLTVGTVKRVELRHRAKFCWNRPNRWRDIAIYRNFKMAVAAIMDFQNFEFLTVGCVTSNCVTVPNFIEIAQNAAEICKF